MRIVDTLSSALTAGAVLRGVPFADICSSLIKIVCMIRSDVKGAVRRLRIANAIPIQDTVASVVTVRRAVTACTRDGEERTKAPAPNAVSIIGNSRRCAHRQQADRHHEDKEQTGNAFENLLHPNNPS